MLHSHPTLSSALHQWIDLGYWLIMASGLPLLALLAYLFLARQWVRFLGKPGIATVLQADCIANLPNIVTRVALALTPTGDPSYVRIRAYAHWSEHLIAPEQLTVGAQLPVRYRLARQTIVMPDARKR